MATKTKMKTQILGLKEFRSNITSLWKKARKDNIRYIVMHHSTPVFEVNPVDEKDIYLESFLEDIKESREQVKRGEVYKLEEVAKELGL